MTNSQVPKKTETLRKRFYLSAIYPFGNIFCYSLFISLVKVYELCINVFELYNRNVFELYNRNVFELYNRNVLR